MKIKGSIVLIALLVLQTGCATAPESDQPNTEVGILIFGDSGYHPDYPDEDDYEDLFDEQAYLAKEWEDWQDDKRPIDEYEPTPFMVSPVTSGVISASGIFGVSEAMRDFCANERMCDFGMMAGDNIYPAGATLGEDGFDDQQRFEDILQDPFGAIGDLESGYLTYATLGNHDWASSIEGGMLQIEYLMNAPGFYMDGPFYSVKPSAAGGDVEIFVIDTSMLLATRPVFEDRLNDDGSEGSTGEIDGPHYSKDVLTKEQRDQHLWLEEQLRDSTARWRLVLAHHPIWSSSGGKFEQARVIRKLLMPALCRYADAYIVGHEHTLEIHTDNCETYLGQPSSKPLVQILSGAAAKQRPVNSNFMRFQEAKYPDQKSIFAEGMLWGFAHLQIEGDNATVRLFSIPDDGSPEWSQIFEFEFSRRSE